MLTALFSALCVAISLDWDWFSHQPSGDPEVGTAVAAMLSVAVSLAITGAAFVAVGLAQGGIVFFLLAKSRFLFAIVPILNLILYFLLRVPFLDETNPLARLVFGVPAAVFSGFLAATILAPVHILLKRRKRPSSIAEGDRSHGLGASLVGDSVQETQTLESRRAAFRRGFLAPVEGFEYLCRYPKLWRYGVFPVVLNLLITIAMLLFVVFAAAWFVVDMHPKFPAGWGWMALEVLCAFGVFVIAVGLALITSALLQGSLCGHYLTKLARAVELHLGISPEKLRDVSWGYQCSDACRDVSSLAIINGGFLLVHVVPGIGSVAGVAGSLYFDAMVLGEDYFDYPMALRGMRRQEKKDFVRKNRFHTLGLGAAVFLGNFIPVLGAVLLAAAVVGAVILHRRLEGHPQGFQPESHGANAL